MTWHDATAVGTDSRIRFASYKLDAGTWSTGLPIFAGTATDIADEMEDWYRDGACDGFMVGLPVVPIDLDSFTQEVVPELQRRGLFRREYSDGTLRDVMGYPKAS